MGSENRSAPDPRGTPRSLSPPPRASLGTSASFSRLWRATHRQQEASSEEQVPVCHGPGPGIRILYAEFATQSDPRHTPIYQAGDHHGRAQTHTRHPPAANTPVNLAGTHRHTDQWHTHRRIQPHTNTSRDLWGSAQSCPRGTTAPCRDALTSECLDIAVDLRLAPILLSRL